MIKSICKLLILIFLFNGCKPVLESKSAFVKPVSKNSFTEADLQFWHQKDFEQDSIPGISLNKWHASNKKAPKQKSIIVAVIDTQIDLNHEDLQGQFWTNPNEVQANGIDDDKNGYVDDVNGWSFLGTKSGNYIVWANFEYVRIVREWRNRFENKTETQIDQADLVDFKEYQRASARLNKENRYYTNWLKSYKYSSSIYQASKDTLKHFFPKEDYTVKQLDSLYKKYKTNDKTYIQRRNSNDTDLGALIFARIDNFESNEKTLDIILDRQIQKDSIVSKNLNIDYNERVFIDNDDKTLTKGYGNNKVNAKIKGIRTVYDHSTKVSGIIAANRANNKGTTGFAQNIKIMPLNISPSGDEHDKDIAMAIRYAVDNGAKVINMSFGKEFSMHRNWVSEAFQYAEQHNVLLVHAAGNDSFNNDTNPFYPSDVAYNGSAELCGNFINVGSIASKTNVNFVSSISNYGAQNVDLFAPGDDIYTTSANNRYVFDGGTSLAAPMVSGAAALIWLYYPKLQAKEVKQILMESGNSYDLEVLIPGEVDKKTKFSALSKSGKVLNVFNAMKMAAKMSKKK
jgi:cell wall-associated protease